MKIEVNTLDIKKRASEFKVGDKIYLTGEIYTARDAAHKKIFEILDKNERLPFDLENAVIYYAGPTGATQGRPIGSCGPTTSSRMDCFTPRLLDLGLGGIIGKGERNSDVVSSLNKNKALYMCFVGGAGALACKCIKKCEVIAFPELGCESVKRLYVEKLPIIVANDIFGGDIFKIGRKTYCELD